MCSNPLKIGISTRIVEATTYSEPRDALAHNWYKFLKLALPNAQWLLIPNLGAESKKFLNAWELDCFILTGGENIGTNSLRDNSERTILDHAVQNNKPILGICRGLQLIIEKFGGIIVKSTNADHIATRHNIKISDNPIGYQSSSQQNVNSYHQNVITNSGSLEAFAFDEDDHIEGVYSIKHPVAGIMWHPERETKPNPKDIEFIRNFLRGKM